MKKPDPLDYGAFYVLFITIWPEDSREEEYLKDFAKWESDSNSSIFKVTKHE